MRNKLLSARKVAELANWHPVTVYKKSLTGGIPGRVKLGGSLRFRKSAIERWIRGGKAAKQASHRKQ